MGKSLCHAALPCRLPCESALSVLPSSRTAHVPLPAYPPCGPHRFFGEPRPRLACGYAAVLCNGITELNSRRGALQFKFGWPPDRAGNRENQLVGSAFLRGSQCTANRVLWCTLVPCQAVSYIPLCRFGAPETETARKRSGIARSAGPGPCTVITEREMLRAGPQFKPDGCSWLRDRGNCRDTEAPFSGDPNALRITFYGAPWSHARLSHISLCAAW